MIQKVFNVEILLPLCGSCECASQGVGSEGLFFCRLAPEAFHGTDILTLAPSLVIPFRHEKSQRKTGPSPAVKIT